MLRIGIVGTENSRAEYYVRKLNVEHHRRDARVVALAGGDTEQNRNLAAVGAITTVVDTVHDLLSDVDAVAVCDRDGRLHRDNAVPLLEAGKHVFVDKPTATTVADVEAMIDAAGRGRAVLASWSVVRLTPAVDALRRTIAHRAGPRIVSVTGPADWTSPHGGLFFYGPHVAEPALEILGNPDVSDQVAVQVTDGAVVALAQADDVHLVLSFVRPENRGRVPWHAAVAGNTYRVETEIDVTARLHRSLDRFIDAAIAGLPPTDYKQLIPPVRLLAAITDRLTEHTAATAVPTSGSGTNS